MADGDIGIIVCARNRLVLWHGPAEEGLLRLPHFEDMESLHPTRADYRMMVARVSNLSFWSRHLLDRALAAHDYAAILQALSVPLREHATFGGAPLTEEDDASPLASSLSAYLRDRP